MELYQLRQFQAAARHKNMTRAASEPVSYTHLPYTSLQPFGYYAVQFHAPSRISLFPADHCPYNSESLSPLKTIYSNESRRCLLKS